MSKFDKILDEIIYVRDQHGPELRKAARAFGHLYGKQLRDSIKNHLSQHGINFGTSSNKTLASIPADHSSFHVDDEGNHQHNDH